MKLTAEIAPPNSLLLVMDEIAEIPESMGNGLVVATASCIAVGTRSDADGTTEVVLSNEPKCRESEGRLQLVFRGVLATPSRSVSLYTVLLQKFLTLPVPFERTAIEIWADHGTEPSHLCIAATTAGKGSEVNS